MVDPKLYDSERDDLQQAFRFIQEFTHAVGRYFRMDASAMVHSKSGLINVQSKRWLHGPLLRCMFFKNGDE